MSMCSFLVHCQDLCSEDILRRLAGISEVAVNVLSHLPTIIKQVAIIKQVLWWGPMHIVIQAGIELNIHYTFHHLTGRLIHTPAARCTTESSNCHGKIASLLLPNQNTSETVRRGIR